MGAQSMTPELVAQRSTLLRSKTTDNRVWAA